MPELTDQFWGLAPSRAVSLSTESVTSSDPQRTITIPSRRAFTAASQNNLLNKFLAERKSLDADLRSGLSTLRFRSRDLAQNNQYIARFLQLLRINVVGPHGIKLQSGVVNASGKPDSGANRKIEDAWARWSKRGQCDVTGTLSLVDLQQLYIESAARDGEVLVRLVKGARNRFRFALELIEADHLDENHNETLRSGNTVRMGVEIDAWRRPVAYHLLSQHPGDDTWFSTSRSRYYRRIPAEEIIHGFKAMRPLQTRGYPWSASAMVLLHHLGAFDEAALVAARLGASKMGFYQQDGDTATRLLGDDTADNGDPIAEADPGHFELLPKGYKFQEWSPEYPHGNYDPFVGRALKGIASALGISYGALASDVGDANYSSMRAAALEDRARYRADQRWMAESLLDRVFSSWLEMALLTGELNLDRTKLEKFNAPTWVPRGFEWVDPLKDIAATEKALANNLKSPFEVAAERGRDLEDVYREIKAARDLASQYGLQGGNNGTANN